MPRRFQRIVRKVWRMPRQMPRRGPSYTGTSRARSCLSVRAPSRASKRRTRSVAVGLFDAFSCSMSLTSGARKETPLYFCTIRQ